VKRSLSSDSLAATPAKEARVQEDPEDLAHTPAPIEEAHIEEETPDVVITKVRAAKGRFDHATERC